MGKNIYLLKKPTARWESNETWAYRSHHSSQNRLQRQIFTGTALYSVSHSSICQKITMCIDFFWYPKLEMWFWSYNFLRERALDDIYKHLIQLFSKNFKSWWILQRIHTAKQRKYPLSVFNPMYQKCAILKRKGKTFENVVNRWVFSLCQIYS